MKKFRISESKITTNLKQNESRLKVSDICREHGISQAIFFNWKAKYGITITAINHLRNESDTNK